MEASTSPHCEMDSAGAPGWLTGLLTAPYFCPCAEHAALHRSERNFFCVDCGGSSICSICVQREHSSAGHRVLQVRKSSYHDAVRISDITKLLDVGGIQSYVINGAKIVFLNGRPQARPAKGALYHCETCQRTLLDSSRFCSIACKLAAMQQDSTLSLLPGGAKRSHLEGPALAMSDEESGESLFRVSGPSGRHRGHRSSGMAKVPTALPMLLPDERDDFSSGESEGFGRMKRRRNDEAEEVSSPFPPLEYEVAPSSPMLSSSWRTHKRKGVPHRAPLA